MLRIPTNPNATTTDNWRPKFPCVFLVPSDSNIIYSTHTTTTPHRPQEKQQRFLRQLYCLAENTTPLYSVLCSQVNGRWDFESWPLHCLQKLPIQAQVTLRWFFILIHRFLHWGVLWKLLFVAFAFVVFWLNV